MLDHDQRTAMGELSDWSVVEGYRFETVGYDLMHNIFLGTAKDLVGSAIMLLIQRKVLDCAAGLEDDQLDRALGNLHAELVQDCKSHGLFGQVYWVPPPSLVYVWIRALPMSG